MSILHDIQQQRPRRQIFDRLGGLLFTLETLEQADVGADVARDL